MPSWLTPGSKDGVRARDCNFTGLIKQFPDSLLGDSWEDSSDGCVCLRERMAESTHLHLLELSGVCPKRGW